MANARLYQQYTEVLTKDVGYAELAQQTVEVLTADVGYAELAQIYVETLAVAVSSAQIYQIYLEALTPAVGSSTDEGVSNTLSLISVANLTWSLATSNTITFSQVENNSLTKFATNSITFSQDMVGWRQYDVSQTIIFTAVAEPTFEESTSNTITFGQTVSVDLARHTFGTLSFDHSVALHLIVKRTVPSNMTLSENVSYNATLNPSTSNTIVFGQNLIRVIEFDIQSTIIFNEDQNEDITHDGTSIIVFGQTADVLHPIGRSPVSTLALTQVVSVNHTWARSPSNTLSLTQTLYSIFPRSVTHTETFYQNIDYTLTKITSNTLTLTQDATETHNKLRRVFANINFTQPVAVNSVINRDITSTLNLTQTVARIVDEDVNNTITFGQNVDYVWSKRVVQTVSFAQTINVVKVIKRSLITTVHLNQNVSFLKAINKRMLSILNFTQGGRIVPVRNRSVSNNLNFTNEAHREVFTKSSNNFVTLSHAVACKHVINLRATQNLNLSQVFTHSNIFNFDIAHTLELPLNQIRQIRIGDLDEIVIPNVQVTLIPNSDFDTPTLVRQRQIMTLSVPNKTVLLPVPEFGDNEGNMDSFTMSYAVDGTVYTTVRRSGTRAIGFQWELSYPKAEELKEFIWNYNTKAMQIQNWKGEIWIVRLLTNPIEFSDQLRPSLCESDSKVTVALEFEGVRIH